MKLGRSRIFAAIAVALLATPLWAQRGVGVGTDR